MNPIQKYPHITESYACSLKMCAIMFLLLKFFLISFVMCLTPKLSKHVTVLLFTYYAIQGVRISEYSSRLITYVPFLSLK